MNSADIPKTERLHRMNGKKGTRQKTQWKKYQTFRKIHPKHSIFHNGFRSSRFTLSEILFRKSPTNNTLYSIYLRRRYSVSSYHLLSDILSRMQTIIFFGPMPIFRLASLWLSY